ncbi:MAG: PDZ domain-containing protein [Anaerolineae bacterium]|nr:PDZ domain-containing protein [Anaerolineae bacterium]
MNARKPLRIALAVLLLVAGATLFYALGIGTGLYVAQSTAAVADRPATATPAPTLAAPTLAPPTAVAPSPTAEPPTPTAALSTPTPPPAPTPLPSPTRQVERGDTFDIFWEAWQVLQDQFFGELPDESELPYAAIQGVIATTGDPYTAFLDPVRAEVVSSDLDGSFEGIGATVRLRADGKLEIVQPLPDHPAIRAGLRAGDVVLQVDGTDIEGMNLYEAVSLIRGPAGTVVRLLVQRAGIEEPFEVRVTRARIEQPVVETERLEGGIAYLRLNRFGQTATDEVAAALAELLDGETQGLILDLRGNPGGYLSAAIEVASQFVDHDPILIERFRDDTQRTYAPVAGGLALDIPLVVLVDGGSASASEIVAGAVQDTERGTLIGTRTLGKGSVQLVNTLSDGSQLRVTTAAWFTPAGRAIHGEGLQPDIEVAFTEEDIASGHDPQLERAIAYLSEGD